MQRVHTVCANSVSEGLILLQNFPLLPELTQEVG